MNIIFGIWRPQGPPVTRQELESMAVYTRRFAPDGEWLRLSPEIGLGVQAQYTHARSRLGVQPASDVHGNLLVYDGRLDNYRDLMRELDLVGEDISDSEIILHAFRHWGNECFARLVGDWAITLWDAQSHSLYLARDHAGTRTLHYSHDASGTVIWATYLDSYARMGVLDKLDATYLSSYLAQVPCYSRTPYQNVRAVLPGHSVWIGQSVTTSSQFWSPVAGRPLRYNSPGDYTEQFLDLFKQSVARRIVSGTPILAELSGGMDSTSIVCVADLLQTQAPSSLRRLDTLSYFDDSERNWDERPYYTLVETKRGQHGFHVDATQYRSSFTRPAGHGALYLYPGIDDGNVRYDLNLSHTVGRGNYRTLLSGIGGDEFTGGNTDPAVNVADLLACGDVFSGFRSAVEWCLAHRLSLRDLLSRSVSFLRSHTSTEHLTATVSSIPWLTEMARQHCQTAILELPLIFYRPFGVKPRSADISETWWLALKSQPHLKPSEIYRFEYRYPYLDRDLLDFLLRLPLDQLSQPGRRRYLMRLALQGIVPEEILERRRKAFLLASKLKHVQALAPRLLRAISTSCLAEAGYIDRHAVQRALESTTNGEDLRWWVLLTRFALLETWLQHRYRIVASDESTRDSVSGITSTNGLRAPKVAHLGLTVRENSAKGESQ